MADEPVVKATKVKYVDVQVVGQGAETSLVEYYDKTLGSLRVTVPTEIIKEGKAPLDDLEAGVPYGIAWEKLAIKPITATDFAKAMRDEHVYTLEDVRAKRAAVIVAINRATGLLLQDILAQLTGGK